MDSEVIQAGEVHAASYVVFGSGGAGTRSHHWCEQDRHRYFVSMNVPFAPSTVFLARNRQLVAWHFGQQRSGRSGVVIQFGSGVLGSRPGNIGRLRKRFEGLQRRQIT
jgi:hypothetical protein